MRKRQVCLCALYSLSQILNCSSLHLYVCHQYELYSCCIIQSAMKTAVRTYISVYLVCWSFTLPHFVQ